MFVPLRDENPTRSTAWVTYTLLVANVAVFLFQLFGPISGDHLVSWFGFVPSRFDGSLSGSASSSTIPAATLFTSLFLHGDLFHLGGNLLYLWIFGNNVEEVLGPVRFLLLYLLSGLGAHALHFVTNAGSLTPTIGASGAISGVLAAYLLGFPHARVVSLLFLGFFVRTIVVPASLVIGVWFLVQVLSGLGEIAGGAAQGIAWFEHIGGFAAGVLAFPALRATRRW